MIALFETLFAAIGRPLVWVGRGGRDLLGTTWHTFRLIVRGRIPWRSVMEQGHVIGNGSIGFITVTLGFLGLISVYQAALQIQQIVPDFTMLGAAFLSMLLREFAPTITGLMIATRVGSGIAAELGSMTVTEQVDALRMCNADPIEYLIVPRTLACAVMMVMLTIYGTAIAYFCGMICADLAFGVNYRTFLNLQLATTDDVIIGVAKAFSYGVAIPIIAGQAGLSAKGGSEGVGWATTSAVVNTSFAVIVLDFILSGVGYAFFP
jgi:phospholipid/cholesterol/gamma-HCH transport system permease protein